MATYSITIPEEIEDLTKELFSNNNHYILSTDIADDFLEDQGKKDYDFLVKHLDDAEIEVIADDFRGSDMFYTMIDEMFSIATTEACLLQAKKIKDSQLELVLEYCSSVSVVEVKAIESYVLALTAAGTDYTDSLELAYLFIDGCSPFTSKNLGLTLSDRGVEALAFLRDSRDYYGNLSLDDFSRKVQSWREKN